MSSLSSLDRGRNLIRGSSMHIAESPRDSIPLERSLSLPHTSNSPATLHGTSRSEGGIASPMLRDDLKPFNRDALSWRATYEQSEVKV